MSISSFFRNLRTHRRVPFSLTVKISALQINAHGPHLIVSCRDIIESNRIEDIGCFISHEEYRDFHDVDCLEKVKHLIDEVAGTLECAAMNFEYQCQQNDICYWSS